MTMTDDFYATEMDLGGAEPAEPADRYGRRILPRGDGTAVPYTRATTLAGSLDGGHGVMVWRKYRAAWGVAQRDELIQRLRAVPADDKATIREVCDKAELIAGTEAAADQGTAAHAVLQRVDQGESINNIHSYYQPLVRNYQEALRIAGITVLPQYVERTYRCARYDIEGHPDNIYQLSDGSLVIGDKKTAADLAKAERSIAAQLALYANSEHMMNYETSQYEAVPEVRKDFALIIVINTEDWSVAIERIDIIYGWGRVRLSAELRESNRIKNIRHPYIAEGHWTPKSKTVLPEAASTNGQGHYSPEAQSAKVAAKLTPGPVAEDTPAPQPPATVGPHHADTPPPRITAGKPVPAVDPATRVDEILAVRKNDKTALQKWAQSLGCTDLQHHRKWLADWIVTATPTSSAIEHKINSLENYGGENTPADRPRTLAETGLPPAPAQPPGQSVVNITAPGAIATIAQAKTLDALGDVWRLWEATYGPGSWDASGAVKQAADARANFIRTQSFGDDTEPPF